MLLPIGLLPGVFSLDEPEEPDVTVPKIPSTSDLPKDASDTVAPPVVLSEENSTSTQPPT